MIIAGGPGRRLAAVTGGAPKALAPFDGQTLIEHQLDRLAGLELEQVVVLCHEGAAAVAARVAARATVIVEDQPLGTAGGLALLPEGPERWLCLNVDHISRAPLAQLLAHAEGACTAALASVEIPVDEGVVTVEDGKVVAYHERPRWTVRVTTGLYVFEASALPTAPRHLDMPDLVRSCLPGVKAWRLPGPWFDAGTPARHAQSERWWREG